MYPSNLERCSDFIINKTVKKTLMNNKSNLNKDFDGKIIYDNMTVIIFFLN